MLLFVVGNAFLGILLGLILGMIFSWFLMFVFALSFGHPESGWNPWVSDLFMGLSIATELFFFVFLGYLFLKIGVSYSEKKLRDQKQGTPNE
jgi:hypothetical protein